MAGREWSRDELVLAMNLYCQLPFGRLHRGNPEIIRLAGAIDRTADSVAMKLCNLASLDPAHQARGVRGLTGASAADRRIWSESESNWNGLLAESVRLREQYGLYDDVQSEAGIEMPEFSGPTESQRTVTIRLAQQFFRRAVLASFESKCCVTGITQPELLVASHIVPWSSSPEHRVNPRNGLCLSRIHDGAFDRGLITFDEDQRLVLSRELAESCENAVLASCFRAFEGLPLAAPHRFRPDEVFLAHHHRTIFRG